MTWKTAEITVTRSSPIKWGYCRSCNARIEWVETEKGKHMPVDWPLRVLSEHQTSIGRMVTVIDGAQSHFVTCPDAAKYRKRR